jgi:tetratricopeptide (TPR) repeat protein
MTDMAKHQPFDFSNKEILKTQINAEFKEAKALYDSGEHDEDAYFKLRLIEQALKGKVSKFGLEKTASQTFWLMAKIDEETNHPDNAELYYTKSLAAETLLLEKHYSDSGLKRIFAISRKVSSKERYPYLSKALVFGFQAIEKQFNEELFQLLIQMAIDTHDLEKQSLAYCYKAMNSMNYLQYKDAIFFFNKSLILKPDDIDTLFMLASAYQNNGEFNKALSSCRRILKINEKLQSQELDEMAKATSTGIWSGIKCEIELFARNKLYDFAERFTTFPDLRKTAGNNDFCLFLFKQFQKEGFKISDIKLNSITEGQSQNCLKAASAFYKNPDMIMRDICLLYESYLGINADFNHQVSCKLGVDIPPQKITEAFNDAIGIFVNDKTPAKSEAFWQKKLNKPREISPPIGFR